MKKVALITGGRQGIGLGIAKYLARDGCNIVIADIKEPSENDAATKELRGMGADVLYCKADVSDSLARLKLLAEIKRKFKRLNVLVNNAGVAPAIRADIMDATEESYERVMRINLQGPYFLTQIAARWMVEQRKADPTFPMCIVNISSISAVVASPSRGEYCISKAGVSMATKLWAARLGEFNIPVYEVRPGIIQTDMTVAVKSKYDKLILEDGLLLQARWGLPEDVGKAVAMLVRGDMEYATGQALTIDGGLSVQRL